ncbi:MAG: TIGR03086 family protein [Acidimicrobiia bacterium]|nr:TIGR03086 family protein [Acidimicrobiia bacterium]
MAADSSQLFDEGLDFFTSVLTRVGPDEWDRPSPCRGWTALDVLGHLGTSVDMGISLLEGHQPTWPDVEPPGRLVQGDPVEWWQEKAGRVRELLTGADLDVEMDTPMGRRTVRDRLAFPAIDLYVHAWDIGRAVGLDLEIPTEVIEFAHRYIDPFPEEMVRGENGAFGPEVSVPEDAAPTAAFVAWTGRQPG